MTIVSVTLPLILLLPFWNKDVFAARISCTDDHLSSCTKRFQTYLDSGMEILKDANETLIGQVCGTYLITSDCLAVFMYYCPTFKTQLQNKVKQFDYACNAVDRSGNWPYMPTISPESNDRIDEELAAKEKANLVDSAIKASVAAAVTILLILICVMADCASKWRIRQRIKKAAAAQGEQPLLKNAENEETVDASSTEPVTKKE